MQRLLFILLLCLLPLPALAARQSPVDTGVVTSGVGWRTDPFGSGRSVYHNGYDIAVPVGTPVYPTQVGTVYFAGPFKGYGQLVAVEHGEGYVTFYGHNSQVLVKPGQQVDTSTVIALSGNTGRSTGPHVHYEIRQLPGYQKGRRDQTKQEVRMAQQADGPGATGKGGAEGELVLPEEE